MRRGKRHVIATRETRAARRDEAVRAVRRGMSIERAAAQWGYSARYIRGLWRQTLPKKPGLRGFDAKRQRHRAITDAARKGGVNCEQLAREFGVSISVIRYSCRKAGVKAPPERIRPLSPGVKRRAALRRYLDARWGVARRQRFCNHINDAVRRKIAAELLGTERRFSDIAHEFRTNSEYVEGVWRHLTMRALHTLASDCAAKAVD